jgi:hypothetical protein
LKAVGATPLDTFASFAKATFIICSTGGPQKTKSKADTAAFTTNAPASTQICQDDEDSNAESHGTDATFEYTAQHVDPALRSRHVITNMEDFMSNETRKKLPAEGSCDKKKDGDRSPSTSICGVAEGDAPSFRATEEKRRVLRICHKFMR